MGAGSKIQGLLDKPNPDYDPNSAASKARRAEFQSNPAKQIKQYLAQKKAGGMVACPTCGNVTGSMKGSGKSAKSIGDALSQ